MTEEKTAAERLDEQRRSMANGGHPDDHTFTQNQAAHTPTDEADRQAKLARKHQGQGTVQDGVSTDTSGGVSEVTGDDSNTPRHPEDAKSINE